MDHIGTHVEPPSSPQAGAPLFVAAKLLGTLGREVGDE